MHIPSAKIPPNSLLNKQIILSKPNPPIKSPLIQPSSLNLSILKINKFSKTFKSNPQLSLNSPSQIPIPKPQSFNPDLNPTSSQAHKLKSSKAHKPINLQSTWFSNLQINGNLLILLVLSKKLGLPRLHQTLRAIRDDETTSPRQSHRVHFIKA